MKRKVDGDIWTSMGVFIVAGFCTYVIIAVLHCQRPSGLRGLGNFPYIFFWTVLYLLERRRGAEMFGGFVGLNNFWNGGVKERRSV